MKIGIVCPYNYFIPGGVQDHVKRQAEVLRARGHEVTVITPRPNKYIGEPPESVVFIGQSRRIRTPSHTSSDIALAIDTELLENTLDTYGFDVIHLHEPLLPMLGLQILNYAKCPTVGTYHAAMPDTLIVKSIVGSIGIYKRSIASKLTAITSVSPAAATTLEDLVDPSDVTIIPNGIDLKLYTKNPTETRERHNILFIGRLERRKGVRHLIDAFAELVRILPDAELDIAGDGPERKMLENRVKSLKLKNVRFHGFISEDEKLQRLQNCGVFTTPAMYGESFGIVLLEAMALGAVTIAGANEGYASVLKDGGRLSLVDTTDTLEYARRLELLLTDPTLRAYWQTWAAEAVTAYEYEDIVTKYERLYQSVVSR